MADHGYQRLIMNPNVQVTSLEKLLPCLHPDLVVAGSVGGGIRVSSCELSL